jgi:hypothetical protein
MCLWFVFLIITRTVSWLRLSRRTETWKTAAGSPEVAANPDGIKIAGFCTKLHSELALVMTDRGHEGYLSSCCRREVSCKGGRRRVRRKD